MKNVKYELLSYKEMLKFIKENYILNNKLIYHRDEYKNKLLGLYYTDLNDINNEYFVGYIENENNKKTIETNLFYRGKGLLNNMIKNFKDVCPDNDIIITVESPMGKVVGTHNHFRKHLPDKNVIDESNFFKFK